MDVAELVSNQPRRDRLTFADGFTPAARRRGQRRRSPTLGEVIEAVACETENDAEVVAAVAHLLHTRTVRWPGSCAHSDPDRRTTAFD